MEENTQPQPQTQVSPEPIEEKTLLEWSAPERPFQKRDRDFWITAIAILVLVSVIFIMIQEFYLVIALISVLFLYYVLSTVPPENVKVKVTNKAVYFAEAHYEWEILEKFWFSKTLGWDTLCIGTMLRFPQSISIIIDPKNKDKIKEAVIKTIPYVENSPSFVDKLTKWFAERLPLENRIEGNTNKDKK